MCEGVLWFADVMGKMQKKLVGRFCVFVFAACLGFLLGKKAGSSFKFSGLGWGRSEQRARLDLPAGLCFCELFVGEQTD